MLLYLVPFFQVDKDLAIRETRFLTFLTPQRGIPAGSYALAEFYCADPECDCRRVTFMITEEKRPTVQLASISYAFDPDDPEPGPFLDPLNTQSPYAEALMDLVYDLVLSDSLYLARLERHYAMVKRAAADPTHPAYEALRKSFTDDPDKFLHSLATLPGIESDGDSTLADLERFLKSRAPVGRNAPCPCGSGKKYKVCCGSRRA